MSPRWSSVLSSCSPGSLGSSLESPPTSAAFKLAGHTSGAELLGLFQVSILHNIVHLLYGVAGIAAARAASTSRTYLIGGGVVYLVLMLYGLVVDKSSSANFVPLNTADNWLHLFLGIAMIGIGVALSRATASRGVTA